MNDTFTPNPERMAPLVVLEPSTGHVTIYLEGHQNAMIDGATPHLPHHTDFGAI